MIRKSKKRIFFFHNANSAIKRSLLIKYPFSKSTKNIEDRIWAKKILTAKKNYKIIYEPKASVYHHHGLHHTNKIDRLTEVTSIMKGIDNGEKLFPEIFNLDNQKIFSCVIGRKQKSLSKKFINSNKELISNLINNNSIKKIVLVLDKHLMKALKIKKNKKFILIKRNKEMENLSIANLLEIIYKKIRKFEPDYFLYFNTDYLLRPKNYLENLINKAIYNLFDIVSFAIEEPSNIWIKKDAKYFNLNNQLDNSNQKQKYYYTLYGLGSIFFFNNLKKINFQNKKVEFIVIKNKVFTQRFSQI